MIYEYCRVCIKPNLTELFINKYGDFISYTGSNDMALRKITELTNDGWRMVAVTDSPDGFMLHYFEREKQPEPEKLPSLDI